MVSTWDDEKWELFPNIQMDAAGTFASDIATCCDINAEEIDLRHDMIDIDDDARFEL